MYLFPLTRALCDQLNVSKEIEGHEREWWNSESIFYLKDPLWLKGRKIMVFNLVMGVIRLVHSIFVFLLFHCRIIKQLAGAVP